MALDPVPTYPGQYNASEASNNPQGSDTRREGDDQIRRMKASEKATWTNVNGAVTSSHEELNRLTGVSLTDPIITFPSGTKMVFYQDAAPTGWTIDQTVDEHSIRLTKGSVATGQLGGVSGGTHDFSVLFATLAEGATPGIAGHSLTDAENGPHTHGDTHSHNLNTATNNATQNLSSNNYFGRAATDGSGLGIAVTNVNNSTAIDNESGFIQSSGSGTAHSHSIDLNLKWAACIVATKD